jgi:hypothetical protein
VRNGRKCVGCVRKDRKGIEAAINSGTALADVSRAFHISRDTLQRHRADHMPKPILSAPAAPAALTETPAYPKPAPLAIVTLPRAKTVESAEDVIADLQRLRNEAFDLFESAKAREDWQRAQQLFTQLVAIIDRFGEMHKVLGPKGSVNVVIDNSSRTLNMLSRLSDAELRAIIAGQSVPMAKEKMLE